jgi:hypothetical protein
MRGFNQLLAEAQADGAALASSVAETSILPAASRVTLLQNYFDRIGKVLRCRAAGRISTLVTAPGTLTLRFKFGAIVVWNSGAIPLNVNAQVNAAWELNLDMVIRALGSGTNATLLGVGQWNSRAVIGSAAAAAGGVGSIVLPDTAPAVGAGFDSTAAQQIDLTAQWSVSNAANSILLHQFSLETWD